ncbi:acyltransferase [uncultured Dubosiella sp.]|uniref:acyltransferase n=1 Tax=uncultured Dubosiella sp. TaxID=1937011 RepID=UPI0025B4F611|nr:acyltransferase [uncultured Dubosiella sp.]
MRISNERALNYLDLMSVSSAIMVTFLHANNCFWIFSATERYWKSANIIESIFYCAVPLFFMISGVTLMDYSKKYSTKTFAKKRMKKVVIPYVFWSLIGIFWTHYLFPWNGQKVVLSFKDIVAFLVNGNGIRYFWFFIPLFMIYISIPFLTSIDEKKRIRIFSGYVVLYLLINGLIPFFNSFFSLEWNTSSWAIPVMGGYLVYPLAGYVIHHSEFSKSQKRFIYCAGIVSLIVMILGTYFSSIRIGAINELFRGDKNLPCLLYSFSSFLFIKDIFSKIKRIGWFRKGIAFFRSYTFSIYLLQFFIFDWIERFSVVDQRSILYRLCFPFVLCTFIVGITKFIRLFSLGRLVLPK